MSTIPAQAVLGDRVAQIDAGPPPGESGADLRLTHIASVMQQYTNTYMAETVDSKVVLDPSEADALVEASLSLADLRNDAPSLTHGPLDQRAQQWVSTARQQDPAPKRECMGTLSGDTEPAVTPWQGTLYTSSVTSFGPGMWRLFLELYYGSDLFPLPWHVWRLPAAGRVLEISGARDWVSLVARYPLRHRDFVFPDWGAVAADCDGVHISLQAVVAVQGFSFATAYGPTAPGFWDVETTHWLRWVFAEPQLIERVD